MKILLLGANGMLGRALKATFVNEELTAWDIGDLDITEAGEVAKRIDAIKPQVVINAAAYTDVDGAEKEREKAWAVNADGVRNVAEAAKEVGATMVHYSTDYVFPGDNERGYTEDDQAGPPVNAYGESKLAGEQALAKAGPAYYLIRTAWLYGAGGKNFVDTMLRLAETKKELSVVNDQYGSPSYTVDVAQATRELLTGDWQPGVYHAVNQGLTTWYALALTIFELAGVEMEVRAINTADYPLPAARPRYSVLNNTRGPQLRTWEEALADYVRRA